jgi:hypothetical protein
MIDFRAQLADALRAAEITSTTSYTWFGRRSPPLDRRLAAALSTDAAREHMTSRLARELYGSFYTQGRPVPAPPRGAPAGPDRSFVEALSRANQGVAGWEPGWRLVGSGPLGHVLAKDGLRVRVRRSDYRRSGAGMNVRLRRPSELPELSPGFYTATGAKPLAFGPEEVELRIYFNVSPEGAASLVSGCTRRLSAQGVGFNLKVANDPDGFLRCDGAVLYLTKIDFDTVREPLSALISDCAPHLREESPAFTKPLVSGVAVGEHLARLGGSFGSSRCRLVAEGLVAAHEAGAIALGDRLDAVARRFAAKGLDIEAPYLSPDAADVYEL